MKPKKRSERLATRIALYEASQVKRMDSPSGEKVKKGMRKPGSLNK